MCLIHCGSKFQMNNQNRHQMSPSPPRSSTPTHDDNLISAPADHEPLTDWAAHVEEELGEGRKENKQRSSSCPATPAASAPRPPPAASASASTTNGAPPAAAAAAAPPPSSTDAKMLPPAGAPREARRAQASAPPCAAPARRGRSGQRRPVLVPIAPVGSSNSQPSSSSSHGGRAPTEAKREARGEREKNPTNPTAPRAAIPGAAFLEREAQLDEQHLRSRALGSMRGKKRSSGVSVHLNPPKKSYAAAAGSACSEAPSKGEKSKGEKSKGDSTSQAPPEAAPAANLATRQMRPATSAPPPAPPVAAAVTAGDGGQSRANQLIAAANAAEFKDLGGVGLNTCHPPPVTLNSLIHVIGHGVGGEVQNRVGDQLQGFQAETLETLREVLQAAFSRLGSRLDSLPAGVTEERLVQLLGGHLELSDRRLEGILATLSRERVISYLIPIVYTLLAHIFR